MVLFLNGPIRYVTFTSSRPSLGRADWTTRRVCLHVIFICFPKVTIQLDTEEFLEVHRSGDPSKVVRNKGFRRSRLGSNISLNQFVETLICVRSVGRLSCCFLSPNTIEKEVWYLWRSSSFLTFKFCSIEVWVPSTLKHHSSHVPEITDCLEPTCSKMMNHLKLDFVQITEEKK